MITLEDLKAICPHTKESLLAPFVEPLNDAMREFDIDHNPARETHFLAQAAHESGGFQWMKEFASGQAYEGRKDIGNSQPGWGTTYKGRGIFQLTGEGNYEKAGTALFGDPDWFTFNPQLAEQPVNACRIAGWFWKVHGLNELADRGDIKAITKRINGGFNGLMDRIGYLTLAQHRLA